MTAASFAESATATLLVRLARSDTRAGTARSLGTHLGGHDVLIFVRDDEVGQLLPARGFPQLLPHAREWRSFLAECVRTGSAAGNLPLTTSEGPRAVSGVAAGEDVVFVLIAAQIPPADAAVIRLLLPLLGVALQGEQSVLKAEAGARLARKAELDAMELAQRLDMTRRQMEQALASLRETAQARDEALHQAKQAVEARDIFFASVTHDLKNPLTAIKGQAQLLERWLGDPGLSDSTRSASMLRKIVGNVSRMTAMINELLDVSRMQTGQALDLDLQHTDLVPFVERIVAAHRELSNKHQIGFTATVGELVVVCDPIRIQRAVENLVDNALKYSPDGRDVEVTVAFAADSGEAVVSVIDRGLGIPGDELPHIFKRFYRAANVPGGVSGTGIGLASALGIVEQHGGRITVDSREQEGSTFRLHLPKDPGAASRGSTAPS